MGVLQRYHPVQICPLVNNREGPGSPARLLELSRQSMVVRTVEKLDLPEGADLCVRFEVGQTEFSFQSKIMKSAENETFVLARPQAMYRRTIRSAPRLALRMPIEYTIWSDRNRLRGRLVDISCNGLCMENDLFLNKRTCLGLSFYIRAARIRILCQGEVAWSRAKGNDGTLFLAGVRFTTISNETRQKLSVFIKEPLEGR